MIFDGIKSSGALTLPFRTHFKAFSPVARAVRAVTCCCWYA